MNNLLGIKPEKERKSEEPVNNHNIASEHICQFANSDEQTLDIQ